MRTKEPWMQLSQGLVDTLDEDVWQQYRAGQCLCAGHSEDECICGAWANVPKPRDLRVLALLMFVSALIMIGSAVFLITRF